MPYQPRRKLPSPAVALVFQVDAPAAPTVQPAVTLTAAGDTSITGATAGGGLLAYGYGSKTEALDGGIYSRCLHSLKILDLIDPANPVLSNPIDLPGRLFAVSDLTHDGFLAWTESIASSQKRVTGNRQIQVGACDGKDLTQVASLDLVGFGPKVADARSLFLAQDKTVTRYVLTDGATLTASGSVQLDWAPSALKPVHGGLLGSDWSHLFLATWNDTADGSVSDWETLRSADVQQVIPVDKGSVLVPVGDYGVDRLDP
jgi:hypothetical protein